MEIGALSLDEVLITCARELYAIPPDKVTDELRARAATSRVRDGTGASQIARLRDMLVLFGGNRRQARPKEAEPGRG